MEGELGKVGPRVAPRVYRPPIEDVGVNDGACGSQTPGCIGLLGGCMHFLGFLASFRPA